MGQSANQRKSGFLKIISFGETPFFAPHFLFQIPFEVVRSKSSALKDASVLHYWPRGQQGGRFSEASVLWWSLRGRHHLYLACHEYVQGKAMWRLHWYWNPEWLMLLPSEKSEQGDKTGKHWHAQPRSLRTPSTNSMTSDKKSESSLIRIAFVGQYVYTCQSMSLSSHCAQSTAKK